MLKKRFYTYFIAGFCALLFSGYQKLQAQEVSVSGKVVDVQQQPLANTSIYLLSAKAEALIKTAVSDTQGAFVIRNVPDGEFVVQVSSVGHETFRSAVIHVAGKSHVLESIVLKAQSQQIGDVVVEGRIPQVQQRDGKLILNVENSTLAAGNNALDVIKRAPGVSVDKDDNLQLMGQQGANVTIDGRQTFMSGEQLATFLKSMNGDQIKSVEVGTSRSAKDDAEGAVGTINIVLKKNRLEGFNGTFLASAAQGNYFRGNSSLSLNYKKNNTTVFGSYGFTHDKESHDIDLDRIVPSELAEDRFFDQDAKMVETNKTHNYRFGIEHKTSSRNTMTLQFTGNNENQTSRNNSVSDIGPRKSVIDSTLHSLTNSRMPNNRYSANFNNELKLDTLGGKLVFDLDWSTFRNNSDIDYEYKTYLADGNLAYAPENWRTGMPTDINIYVGKIDFTKNIGKGMFETGIKYSRVKSDNDLGFEVLEDDTWKDFEGRQNHFVYTEQIAAGYVDYSRLFGRTAVKAGVRMEYTFSDAYSVTNGKRNKRNYPDFFPSVSLSHTFNENNILSLSYARKISRPNYRYLNPMPYYIDKFTYMLGNAYLNPEYIDGFTLNYTLYRMFNITLGTDIKHDAIVESMAQDEVTGESWIIRENLARSITSYLNVNAPVQIGNFWSMNNNLTGIYMHFKGPIAGEYANLGSFFFQGKSTHNFKLTKGLTAELALDYNSSFLYNVYKIHARWGADLGVNYNFKDQRSSLKLAGTDIFRTQKNNVTTDFGQFNSDIRQYNDNQTIRLTYTYKFGNLKQQFRRNKSDSEEKNRAL